MAITSEAELVIYAAGAAEDLSGTGSVANATALEVGAFYTLFVGAERVRFRFGATAPTATTADAPLGADAVLPFRVDNDSRFIAVIHYDGTTAHVAALLKSSPGSPT